MTHILQLRARELRIPFRTTFKHAAAERAVTSTVWVEASAASGTTGFGEGCPRPYVTGETVASATAFIGAHESDLRERVHVDTGQGPGADDDEQQGGPDHGDTETEIGRASCRERVYLCV